MANFVLFLVPLIVLSGSTKPIPVSNLLEYCTDHRKDGNKGFAEEFKVVKIPIQNIYILIACKI